MKLECVKEKLVDAITKAEKITSKNPTLPVLRCLLLKASKNTLNIRATNLELGIDIKIPAKVESEGIIAIPAAILANFVSQIQSDKHITLEVVNNNLIIESGSGKATINSLSHDDFPSIPTVEHEKSFSVGIQELVQGFKAVVYSASVASMKPELASVFVNQDDDTLIFAATDSFRLAEKRVRIKKGLDIGQILVPFKSVLEILRVFGDSRDEVEVVFNKNQIAFTFGSIYLTSRVVDGVFPDYKQIIPKESQTEVIVLKQDLIQALKIANVFSDVFHQVTFQVTLAKKSFEIRTRNAEVGENNHVLSAAISGQDVTISFNYKYIIDCFQSIPVDSVSLQFNGNNRPMVIRGVSDSSFTYLVMPMNK